MPDSNPDAVIRRLREVGPWFWELTDEEEPSLLDDLVSTQSCFVEAVCSAQGRAENVVASVLSRRELAPGLAVKHAMIATGFSAELMDRVVSYFQDRGIDKLSINVPGEAPEVVQLCAMPGFNGRLSNKAIQCGSGALHRDLLVVVMFGAYARELRFSSFRRCSLGSLAGRPGACAQFFREAYLRVSPQVGGAGAVELGSKLQRRLVQELEGHLGGRVEFARTRDNRLPAAVGEGDQYDAVYRIGPEADPRAYVAVEVAFQETTNSVIERKARQAKEARHLMERLHYKACYIVGGAGWFARPRALRTLVENSDLCVSPNDIPKLADYIASL
ncbi:MAG: hypothetical protein A2Z18_07965 [Armatimonadetes bacterium RBG_16_58_9]|nr:MAG: hypothetical protein A2Z18_07965 [Armatimonadetes bacterium RBG_16_58_9]